MVIQRKILTTLFGFFFSQVKEWRRGLEQSLTAISSKVEVVHSRIENSFLGSRANQEDAMSGGNLIKVSARFFFFFS